MNDEGAMSKEELDRVIVGISKAGLKECPHCGESPRDILNAFVSARFGDPFDTDVAGHTGQTFVATRCRNCGNIALFDLAVLLARLG